MSADNGIYILQTPKTQNDKSNFECRVIHATAIENITYDNPEGDPQAVVDYFERSEILNKEDAIKLAENMQNEILHDDFCPFLEYGICLIALPHPFSYYQNKVKNLK